MAENIADLRCSVTLSVAENDPAIQDTRWCRIRSTQPVINLLEECINAAIDHISYRTP